MKCIDVRALLPEHADGGLPDPLGMGIETHLAGCSDCQSEFKALRHVCALLDETPAPVVQIDTGRLHEEALQRERRRARRWRRLATAAVAASILLAGFALLPRLSIRLERGQLVIAWGMPEPQPPTPPVVIVDQDVERLQDLERLVQALALDVQNREVTQQQELVRLQTELERLRQESVNLRLSTEQDVSLITRHLQQAMKEKGE